MRRTSSCSARWRWIKYAIVAVTFAALVIPSVPQRADAHAELERSDPLAGAQYPAQEPPSAIVLTFGEAVRAADDAIVVYDSAGRAVGGVSRPTKPDDRTVRVKLPGLPDGGYVAAWKVVSADSHPIQGSIVFTVGRAVPVSERVLASVDAGADSAVEIAFGLLRALAYGGALLLAGIALIAGWLWPGGGVRTRAPLLVAAAVVMVCALLVIPLQAAYSAGGFSDAWSSSAISDVLRARFGQMALTRALLALGCVGALWGARRSGDARSTGVLVALFASGALATFTFAGHAETGRWPLVAIGVDLVHLFAAAVWLSGVVLLVLAFRQSVPNSTLLGGAQRFSGRIAAPAISVVVLSGTVQALRQSGALDDFVDTTYGRLVLAKVLLVGATLVVAAFARRALQKPAADPEPRVLYRVVRLEVVHAIAILAVTAVLVNTVPARETSEHANHRPTTRNSFETQVKEQGYTFAITVDPNTAGTQSLTVRITGPDGQPFTPIETRATVADITRDLPPASVPLEPKADLLRGDLALVYADTWRLTITAVVDEFAQAKISVDIPIH